MKPDKWKNRLSDFLLTIGLILSLVIAMYLMPPKSINIYTAPIMLLVMIPTIMALVNGAPFVPTPIEAAEKMLEIANIKPGEKIYDIGCGDGRMVYLAAKKYGADATGFELSPLVYFLARVRHFLWRSKAKIKFANFKNKNLSDADVIVCYLLPDTLARLQSKLDRELKKGARVVSYAFPIGDWQPIRKEERKAEQHIAPIWVYVKQ